MRDVGDVDPELPLALTGAFQANGVVEVFGIIGINSDDLMTATILPPGPFRRFDLLADRVRLVQHPLGEVERKVVLANDREHIHPFGVRRAEDFDDFALGIHMARRPLAQLHDHFVALLRRASGVARRGHVDVLGDARVVRDDVKELPAALQRADQLRPRPLQDPDHAAGGLIPLIPPRDTRENIAPHQHMVAVHRGRGGILRDADGRELSDRPACKKPTPARFMRMRPGTRSAASGSA